MNDEMTERSILDHLDERLRSTELRAQVQPIVERVRLDLGRQEKAVMAWEPIPLAIFNGPLPAGIRSSWIFILRAGANTGAERHPNSVQRMMSLEGIGDLQIRAGAEAPWQSNVLVADPQAPLERRWISIPQNAWHQPVVPQGAHWVVISFHTVPAAELIEERPDSARAGATKQMLYLNQK